MTDPAQELLENSLKIKNAARELFQSQLKTVITAEDEYAELPSEEAADLLFDQLALNSAYAERMDLITAKKPAARTAEEYLFFLGEVFKHAGDCTNLHCKWKTLCWRLKGLKYHIERLKQKDRATADAMRRLWERQISLEMDIDAAHHSKPHPCKEINCPCKVMENYKLFFMKCHVDMEKGLFVHIPYFDMGEGPDASRENRSLLVVMMHFLEQMKKRYNEVDKDAPRGKRNVPTIFHFMNEIAIGQEVLKKSSEDARIKAKEEFEATERKWKKESIAMIESQHGGRRLAKTINGKNVPIMEIVDSMSRRDIENLVAGKSISGPSSFDPMTASGSVATTTGLPQKAEAALYKKTCSHDSKTCNCTFDDTVVNIQLGTLQELSHTKRFDRKPTPANMTEFKRRIFIIMNTRGAESGAELSALPLVRVVTCMINGIQWRVAYNGDYHNFFSEDQYKSVITQYMFAVRYYTDTQIIMYNFLDDRFSRGKDRLEALLKDIKVKNHVVWNLEHARDGESGLIAKRITKAFRDTLSAVVRDKTNAWYSGGMVKGNSGQFAQLWQNSLTRDREQFDKIVSYHGSKIPGRPGTTTISSINQQQPSRSNGAASSTQKPRRELPKNPFRTLNDAEVKENQEIREKVRKYSEQLRAPDPSPEPMKKTPMALWTKADVLEYLESRRPRIMANRAYHKSFLDSTDRMFGTFTFESGLLQNRYDQREVPLLGDYRAFPPEFIAKIIARVEGIRELREQDLRKMSEEEMKEFFIASVIKANKTKTTQEFKRDLALKEYERTHTSCMWKQLLQKREEDREKALDRSLNGEKTEKEETERTEEPPRALAELSEEEDVDVEGDDDEEEEEEGEDEEDDEQSDEDSEEYSDDTETDYDGVDINDLPATYAVRVGGPLPPLPHVQDANGHSNGVNVGEEPQELSNQDK